MRESDIDRYHKCRNALNKYPTMHKLCNTECAHFCYRDSCNRSWCVERKNGVPLVDALKFRLVQCDTFYGGQSQQNNLECLMMLVEVINKGSVPCCGSNYNNSTWVSLPEILFSFRLENILSAMHADWDPPHLSPLVCYILHLRIPLPCKNL